MRIALVYDCFYPHTVGGAERWLRQLATDLGPRHEVTYLTCRHWPRGEEPVTEGFEVRAVAPGGPLYTASGRRRLAPALRFAVGVLVHLVRHRRSYDVVHCLSYPYFPLLAVRLALAGPGGPRVLVEWLECLSPGWWRAYAGRLGGTLGLALQRLCVRLTPAAFVFSRHTERRVREAGLRGELHRLPGLYMDGSVSADGGPREHMVLFAGRHVPDKRPVAVVEALAIARREHPDLRAVLVGDGPERPRVLECARRLGLERIVDTPGFVARAELDRLVRSAACLVAPSVREGFGMVVLEAAAAGTPVVVCEAPDNAAAELVEPGVNGELAPDTSPAELAAAILRVLGSGDRMQESTARWFAENRHRFSMAASIETVERVYLGD
jgi:glycosyltransferase involved in cell wall biosynthesis